MAERGRAINCGQLTGHYINEINEQFRGDGGMGEEKFSSIPGTLRRFQPCPPDAAISGQLRFRHSPPARHLPRKAGFFPLQQRPNSTD